MKKILIVLVLSLFSIAVVSCGGSNSNTTNTHNLKISESTAEWDCLGEVECFSGGYNSKGVVIHPGAKVWVKQIGGKAYYKAGWGNDGSSLVPNPHYGENNERGKAKYKFTRHGDEFYVIF